jgi:hypothetical protein
LEFFQIGLHFPQRSVEGVVFGGDEAVEAGGGVELGFHEVGALTAKGFTE